MNCRDVHTYFEQQEPSPKLSSDTEMANHISGCDSCRHFLEIRKDICARLCLLRYSVPNVSGSLDASVIANYRQAMTARQTASTPSRRTSLNRLWPLGVTTAAVLVVLAAALVMRKPRNPAKPNLGPLPTGSVARVDQPEPAKSRRSVARPKKNAYVAKNVTPKAPGAKHLPAAVPAFRPDDSQEFRSLMYCDELACDGGMNVVRVQLPALPSGFSPAASAGARPVSAEVLVGADGFARGIRIVH